jgi:hypothetical protein
MFETKSELRKIATKTAAMAAAITVSITITGCATPLSKAQISELKFVNSKFIDGAYVEGFTPGVADYGITMEMLLQRKSLFDDSSKFHQSVTTILEDETLSGNATTKSGYLFENSAIKIDLAGKFAFTSAVVDADNKKNRDSVLSAAQSALSASTTPVTDFTVAWLTLGLQSNKLNSVASDAAKVLIAAQDSDGGFDDYTANESTTDATGLALLALSSVRYQGNSEQTKAIDASIKKAQTYLVSNLVQGNHFESYGSANVNGTAYAYMGLKSSKADSTLLSKLQNWLKKQVMKDGGVQAGFAPGASNVMSTSQAVLAINGGSYLDLIH